MALNMTSVKQRLLEMERNNTVVSWKMDVKLPAALNAPEDFDTLFPIAQEALEVFWNSRDLRSCQSNFDFEIVGLVFKKMDWRNFNSDPSKNHTALRIEAVLRSTIGVKDKMLIDKPVTLSLSGTFFLDKRTNKIKSVKFTALTASNLNGDKFPIPLITV